MGKEAQIKSIKSWGYMTNLDTQENRDTYWHQHVRDQNLVVSGVYYLYKPDDTVDLTTSVQNCSWSRWIGKYFGEMRIETDNIGQNLA